MKALIYYGIKDLRLENLPVPVIESREALLRVHAAAICATDLRVRLNGHRGIAQGEKRILGHEVSGEIVEVGSGIKHLPVGKTMAAITSPVLSCGRILTVNPAKAKYGNTLFLKNILIKWTTNSELILISTASGMCTARNWVHFNSGANSKESQNVIYDQ